MINWQCIDTVLLDMDGTLLDLQFDNYFWQDYLPRRYAELNGISHQASSDHLASQFHSGEGTLDWYCLDHWSRTLDMDIPALKREVRHMISIRPFALEFLEKLNARGLDVVMVTNAHRTTLDIKMAEVDLTGWFSRVVVSHDLEVAKENQDFWHRLQALHPFDPSRTLLIDDTESVLACAQSYGIAHLLTLLQPDSSRQLRIDTQFPGIHHFDEIMPHAARTGDNNRE